jgi:hypothetical protein
MPRNRIRSIAPEGQRLVAGGGAKRNPRKKAPSDAPRRGAGGNFMDVIDRFPTIHPDSFRVFLRPIRGGKDWGGRSGDSASLHPRLACSLRSTLPAPLWGASSDLQKNRFPSVRGLSPITTTVQRLLDFLPLYSRCQKESSLFLEATRFIACRNTELTLIPIGKRYNFTRLSCCNTESYPGPVELWKSYL